MRILIVGSKAGTGIGGSFERAATRLGVTSKLFEIEQAWRGLRLARSLSWRFRDRKPTRFGWFNERLVAACESWSPDLLLCTGMAHVSSDALKSCGNRIVKANFLTDDPWNRSAKAGWFLESLKEYDILFTPRYANMPDLAATSRARIAYLRFGFDSDLFNCPHQASSAPKTSDVIFAGGADPDRVPFISSLNRVGVDVALYGSYWSRFGSTRGISHGQIGPSVLAAAISTSRIGLCLVRRANRDGHCMRTFEMPAVGIAMVVEDTQDHREIFGPEWSSVAYFSSTHELIEKTRFLLRNDSERYRLMSISHRLIVGGKNTYDDRLTSILKQIRATAGSSSVARLPNPTIH